jgi:hypothetical protein
MAAGFNVQLKEALHAPLGTLRQQLLATPPPVQPAKPVWRSAVPADAGMSLPQPPRPGGVSAAPADPMLARLDELISALNEASALKEGADTVEQIALRMRKCRGIVFDLETRFKFGSIKLAPYRTGVVDLGNILGCVELAIRYYERLAFYKTAEGKKFLKGAAVRHPENTYAGNVGVRSHHFEEVVDPLVGMRPWNAEEYFGWAKEQTRKNLDPIDHIIEFLIDRNTGRVSDYLEDVLCNRPRRPFVRLHPTTRVGEAANVQIRTHVPGDETHKLPSGKPRMWTYQVKVATGDPMDMSAGVDVFKLGSWNWTCAVWSHNAFTLPILRVVHTVGNAGRQAISEDFTRSTLYAMQGPSTMRCYPGLKFHSALFDTEAVSAAGMLVANDGRVVAIDNRSGHYQPGFRQLLTAVQFLERNQVFKHDAFVSLHVRSSGHPSGAEALYFSPREFIEVAQRGMPFDLVAGKLARTAQQYRYGLPVPAAHVDLIPASLSDFSNGRHRWDRMLVALYGEDHGLEAIVADLKATLKPSSTPKWVVGRRDGPPDSKTVRREGDHPALAAQTLQAIEQGGAYCNLPELVRKLIAATRTSGGLLAKSREQLPLIQASQRYQDIAKRLGALTPERGTF